MNDISEGVKRINEIINNLQSLIRDTNNIEKSDYNIHDLIKESLLYIRQRIKNHHIKLSLNLETNIPDIKVSGIQFKEVISNLIDNAVNALDTVSSKDKKIIVSARQDNDSIHIYIIDNGPGIKNEAKEKIFDPLYSTKIKSDSIGLGLYIVNTIIDTMGGTIEVLDNEFGGATFHIRYDKQLLCL
jgi:signal transduction histidine kinase